MSDTGKQTVSETALLRALRNTGVSVLYQDAGLLVTRGENLPAAWTRGHDLAGLTDHEFLPPEAAKQVVTLKRAVLAGAAPGRTEISVPGEDGEKWFDLWIDGDRSADGQVRQLVTTAVDITEQKQREQTLRMLLREVSHRSKNLLAIIQSIASQTGRYAPTIGIFLTRFRGRIQSLASSQDLVTSSNWRGADLRDLLFGQVARYTATPENAIVFSGARPWLTPNAALHVGLALHELAVNSVSYGALASPDGTVTVTASVTEAPETVLSLNWTERIGAAADDTAREKRFGSVALERVVPASLNGSAELTFRNGLLTYELKVPKSNFEMD
ncbi:MAG: HWE histidine kinase domain-containing protein [Rhizobiaceae bacterium]